MERNLVWITIREVVSANKKRSVTACLMFGQTNFLLVDPCQFAVSVPVVCQSVSVNLPVVGFTAQTRIVCLNQLVRILRGLNCSAAGAQHPHRGPHRRGAGPGAELRGGGGPHPVRVGEDGAGPAGQ